MSRMYEKYYQEFCNEVHGVLASYIYWRTINSRMFSEEKLLSSMNETPLSWTVTRHSLQVNVFMVLGRIFDTDKNAFSADNLLKCCINEIEVFSLENLRIRKIDENKEEPEWLPEYMEGVCELVEIDFSRLRDEVAKHRKVFESVYKPIRNKIFAHNDKNYICKADELWSKTNIQELENIIWFLNELKQVLFDAYQNGKKPNFTGRVPDVGFYERDFNNLLDRIKKT